MPKFQRTDFFRRGIAIAAAILVSGHLLLAQSSSSAINGVITDSNQAVLAGATVTLKNVDTNVARVTVSNGSGNYFFASVPPARYTLTIVQRDFRTESISAFDVGVAQAVT